MAGMQRHASAAWRLAMASWGVVAAMAFTRLRHSPEQYFLALHVGQALSVLLSCAPSGGWVARWKRTVAVVSYARR